MSWIKEIDESEADGKLHEIYTKVKGSRGKVSNIMKAQSLNPDAMNAHLDLYLAIMFRKGGNISREQRELIGTAVSLANSCGYCIEHHAAALNFYWKDKDRLREFIENYQTFNLPENDRKVVDYAVKLTMSPSEIGERDIETLRDAGFKDDDILLINMITAYFNFVNRVILGLGVEFSTEEVEGYKY
ncbi:peroxidase-related enzyme [bacterium]|nr:peroxidase-related enzyme [bacterium]